MFLVGGMELEGVEIINDKGQEDQYQGSGWKSTEVSSQPFWPWKSIPSAPCFPKDFKATAPLTEGGPQQRACDLIPSCSCKVLTGQQWLLVVAWGKRETEGQELGLGKGQHWGRAGMGEQRRPREERCSPLT